MCNFYYPHSSLIDEYEKEWQEKEKEQQRREVGRARKELLESRKDSKIIEEPAKKEISE